MKKILIIIASIIGLFVLIRFGYWLYTYALYANALDEQEKEWVSTAFVPSKIVGVVYQLNAATGANCFSNLIIKETNGEKFASGVCLCDLNKDFAQFVAVGDSIYKPEGSKKIYVIKSTKEKREFDFPFCEH